jgi:hypothetical protein
MIHGRRIRCRRDFHRRSSSSGQSEIHVITDATRNARVGTQTLLGRRQAGGRKNVEN